MALGLTRAAAVSLLTLVLALAACGGGDAAPTTPPTIGPPVEYPIVLTPSLVAAGGALYDTNCTVCHGNPGVDEVPRQYGAPLHDVNGHTWHHPDRQLVDWVLNGTPGGTRMPAFARRLSEAEAASILAYIKSTWPAEVQERQDQTSEAWEAQLQ
jgi:mono/diheme cytochrome c family protein